MKMRWLIGSALIAAMSIMFAGLSWPGAVMAPTQSGELPVEFVEGNVPIKPGFMPMATVLTGLDRAAGLIEPVNGFKARITKKPFGIYITPETSPVRPERFAGYHTGADAEYEDVAGDVLVRAAADGTVLLARVSGGYGGVAAIQHMIIGQQVVGIYGHLRPNSLPRVGAIVTVGQQIGVLGTGGTAETDSERKHLHFGLVRGAVADLRGYVASESELSGWLDPLLTF